MCNNLPRSQKLRCRDGFAEDCCMLLTLSCNTFSCLQFLAQYHPYITCFTHFSQQYINNTAGWVRRKAHSSLYIKERAQFTHIYIRTYIHTIYVQVYVHMCIYAHGCTFVLYYHTSTSRLKMASYVHSGDFWSWQKSPSQGGSLYACMCVYLAVSL